MIVDSIRLDATAEIELLAWLCLGDSYEQAISRMDEDSDDDEFAWGIDAALERQFGCDLSGFQRIAEALLAMTPKAVSSLTGQEYHAFLLGDDAIIKSEAI